MPPPLPLRCLAPATLYRRRLVSASHLDSLPISECTRPPHLPPRGLRLPSDRCARKGDSRDRGLTHRSWCLPRALALKRGFCPQISVSCMVWPFRARVRVSQAVAGNVRGKNGDAVPQELFLRRVSWLAAWSAVALLWRFNGAHYAQPAAPATQDNPRNCPPAATPSTASGNSKPGKQRIRCRAAGTASDAGHVLLMESGQPV